MTKAKLNFGKTNKRAHNVVENRFSLQKWIHHNEASHSLSAMVQTLITKDQNLPSVRQVRLKSRYLISKKPLKAQVLAKASLSTNLLLPNSLLPKSHPLLPESRRMYLPQKTSSKN